jgi:hypothetical protein
MSTVSPEATLTKGAASPDRRFFALETVVRVKLLSRFVAVKATPAPGEFRDNRG